MIYLNFIDSEKKKNLLLAQEILDNNKTTYKIKGSSLEAYQSIVVSLKMLFHLSDKEIKKDLIFDGYNDSSIDAIYVDKKKRTVYILDVKKTDAFERVDIINNFLGEFKRNFIDLKVNLASLNQLAYKQISLAKDYYHNKSYNVVIYFVRTGFNGNASLAHNLYKKNIDKELSSCSNILYEFIGNAMLVSGYFEKNNIIFDHKLIFDDNDVFYDKNNKIAVGKIPVKEIIEMVKEAEGSGYNIFDDNVRVDQENEALDDDLKKTLKDNNERFYLFHNGITISSLHLDSPGGKQYDITNPQILNGCQSVKSLQKIYNEDKKIIGKSLIMCRLFEGVGGDDINAVCQSTNSQRPIYTWDLRSNDLIQKILEVLLVEKGYSYNRKITRKRGFKKIVITEITQWIESCINKKPAVAKSNKKGLFDISDGQKSYYFKKIFSSTRSIDDIAKVCSVCLFVKNDLAGIKKGYKKEEKPFLDHANLHIMAYVYNYGKEDRVSVLEAIRVCQKAAESMRNDYDPDYSNNNIFKNPKTWNNYIKK